MADDSFTVLAVEEFFDVPSGGVLLRCEGGLHIPLDRESYAAARQAVAEARGVPAAAVTLEGLTLILNDDGVPILPE